MNYAYTFNPMTYSRPWGQVPDLVNINGVWGIPENWSSLPEGAQPVTRITLVTNNKNLDTNERYVDVVHLPGDVDSSSLPAEVRKYLINVDGSDAGHMREPLPVDGLLMKQERKNTGSQTVPLLPIHG